MLGIKMPSNTYSGCSEDDVYYYSARASRHINARHVAVLIIAARTFARAASRE